MQRTSLKISFIIFFLAIWGHASACPPTGYHIPRVDRCGSYGCVNGMPAVVIPGYPNGGPYPPTTIIIQK